jgi:threonine dehydrogenase-like Zn-dependent dehydrogenase
VRALVLSDDGVRFQDDRHDPVPAPGEVLVRVVRAGICETDLQLIKGYHGFRGVLGHEFVGLALGGALEGRRVVGEINCSCLACDTCRAGRPGHCPHRTVLGIVGHDGAFADLIAVPERNLHAVPDGVDDDMAVFVEPVAAAFQVPAQVTVRREDRVAVLGDGRLGNLCAQVLASLSDHVMVVGKHPEKLAVLEAMGIEGVRPGSNRGQTGVRPGSDPVAAATRGQTGVRPTFALRANGGQAGVRPHSFDLVVDCTGSPTGLPAALGMVRPRGTVVLKTTIAGEHALSLAPVVVDEVTIVGSRCGPFDQALDALAHGLVDVGPLIAERFDLADGVRGLERAAEPGVLKVLLDV